MAGKYELKQGASGKYTFNLKAGNGQVILTSQPYADKAGASNGIKSVQSNCGDDNCFDRKKSKNGEPFFTLKSSNGQIIGKSEMYTSASAMENGIASVKSNGPSTTVKEV